jgi:hypothetical protein
LNVPQSTSIKLSWSPVQRNDTAAQLISGSASSQNTVASGSAGFIANQDIGYELYGSQVESEVLHTNAHDATEHSAVLIAVLGYDQTEYEHTGLTPNSTWHYKLYTKNDGSLKSIPANFTAVASGLPGTVTNWFQDATADIGSGISQTSLTIRWEEPSSLRPIVNYRIHLLPVENGTVVTDAHQPFEIDLGGSVAAPVGRELPYFERVINRLPTGAASFNYPSLKSGTQYRLRISAVSDIGQGAYNAWDDAALADGAGYTLSKPVAPQKLYRADIYDQFQASSSYIKLEWPSIVDSAPSPLLSADLWAERLGGEYSNETITYDLYGDQHDENFTPSPSNKIANVNGTSYSHAVVPGARWYYKLMAKNRGALRSEVVAYEGLDPFEVQGSKYAIAQQHAPLVKHIQRHPDILDSTHIKLLWPAVNATAVGVGREQISYTVYVWNVSQFEAEGKAMPAIENLYEMDWKRYDGYTNWQSRHWTVYAQGRNGQPGHEDITEECNGECVMAFDHHEVTPGSTFYYEIRVRAGRWMQTRQGANFMATAATAPKLDFANKIQFASSMSTNLTLETIALVALNTSYTAPAPTVVNVNGTNVTVESPAPADTTLTRAPLGWDNTTAASISFEWKNTYTAGEAGFSPITGYQIYMLNARADVTPVSSVEVEAPQNAFDIRRAEVHYPYGSTFKWSRAMYGKHKNDLIQSEPMNYTWTLSSHEKLAYMGTCRSFVLKPKNVVGYANSSSTARCDVCVPRWYKENDAAWNAGANCTQVATCDCVHSVLSAPAKPVIQSASSLPLLTVRWDKATDTPLPSAPDAVSSYQAQFRRVKSALEQSESETTSVPGAIANRTLSEFNTWTEYTSDGELVDLRLDKLSEFTLAQDKKIFVTQIAKESRNCRSMCNVHAALVAHEQYQVRVRSVNALGHSDWSPWSDTNDGAGSTV